MSLFKGKLLKSGKLFAGKLFGFNVEIVVQPVDTGGGGGTSADDNDG